MSKSVFCSGRIIDFAFLKKIGLSFSRLTSAIRVNVILRWQVSKETGSASLGAITIKFSFIN